MVTYIILGKWTEQGLKNSKDSIERADQAAALTQEMGGTLKDIYWTLGKHDVVVIADFPDEEAAAAWGLKLGARGNVRTLSMRAFGRTEMQRIIDRAK